MGILHKVKDLSNIFTHTDYTKDKAELYGKDQVRLRQYSNWLDRQLKRLDAEGLAVLAQDSFEKLVIPDCCIYCIRRPHSHGNPRTLFFALMEDEGEPPVYVLLTAFQEKNKGDYGRGIALARRRMGAIAAYLKEEKII